MKVQVDTASILAEGITPISYNYTPDPSVYRTETGRPADVYCYPRVDAWVLGGTRLVGSIDDRGRWTGEEIVGKTIDIDGVPVPEPVLELNRDLIRMATGVDIARCMRTAVVGYRCARDQAFGGVRLDVEKYRGKQVVHNYGHGGAGVTLSWSSAVRVAQLVDGTARRRTPAGAGAVGALLQRLVEDALDRTA